MAEWCYYGEKARENFERDLRPDYLLEELKSYQKYFGDEFGIKDLLAIKEMKVKTLLTEAISRFPEYLLDQIGMARNSSNFKSIPGALESLTSVLEEYLERENGDKDE